MEEKVYFSCISDPDKWYAPNIAYMFAIPRRWWSIKHWILVNSFLKGICGFIRR